MPKSFLLKRTQSREEEEKSCIFSFSLLGKEEVSSKKGVKSTLETGRKCKKAQQKINGKSAAASEGNSKILNRKRSKQHSDVKPTISATDNPLKFKTNKCINNERQPSVKISQPAQRLSERVCFTTGKEKEQGIKPLSIKASESINTFDEVIWDGNKHDMKSNDESRETNINTKQEGNLGTRNSSKPDLSGVFSCGQCGKTFKTKYTLSIHMKMPDHTENRPFVCSVCGKGFRLSSTLCRHKIIHTDRKPYECPSCDKSFNRSSTLKTHMRTHSEQKAFVCEICGKGFHQKGNLRNHVFVHTGEKPFKCSECHRAFNKMSNLKFHMHTHSDNLPYYCKTCRKRFLKKTELKQHIEEVHG